MGRLILSIIGICVSCQAVAIGVVTGKVIQVRVDQSGLGMVIFDQSVGGAFATCRNSAYSNALSFNTNNAGGRSILAMALAAKNTGDTIQAYGDGSCDNYGGAHVENWSYGVVL